MTIRLLILTLISFPALAAAPEVWMSPSGADNGRQFRELFEHPDAWKDARASVDVLFTTDLHLQKQFTDEELGRWLPMIKGWNLKLGMEVGAIKPWGETGAKTFRIEKPMWDRVQRLGGVIDAIAMDEPLLCVRRDLKKNDAYAVEETANYIELVRKNFPNVRVGDIEPYPSIALEDHYKWIEALQKKLKEKGVRGLDFYRLDVNWVVFTVLDQGNWKEVRQIELYCRRRQIPFSLIYWASGYPAMERRKLADDSTWCVGIMQQGYDYAAVDGAPDQYVIESWINGVPGKCIPDGEEFTFTRSARDFANKFVRPRRESEMNRRDAKGAKEDAKN